ncbi:hypothetical protein BHF68_01280 [Desulfuribacillus alkaliarsenatis]|uniref:Putative manganese efflux pump MntP n=2 Tax=Desulfuribacillus alkaliarsenatis TaxID=766136 RepID=A0A1E5G6F7_9FIRM|nr:hypothetical protein BHF68_01280 [Desulfuribacillus alkaliarsenatis]
MSFITIFLIAVALGIDAFSVCVGIGLCGIRRRQIYIISITVGIFHVLAPLIGMLLGHLVGEFIGTMANVFGAIVLLVIGGYYIIAFVRDRIRGETGECAVDMSLLAKPLGVVILAASVSFDALAVGFGLGALGMNVFASVLIIGVVAGLMTFAGLILGKRLGNIIGNKAELIGGILLVGIAMYLLVW